MNNRISEKVREQIFKRDGYKCKSCGIDLRNGIGGLHHIIPKSKGGSNDPSNLISLCNNCNHSIGDRIVEFTTTPISSQLVKLWVGFYDKAPKITSLLSVVASILGLILGLYFSNAQQIRDQKEKKENLNYYTQIEQLKKTEENIEDLLLFVKEQQLNMKKTQDALVSLKEEKEKLQPLVESDKKVIESLFQAQEERNISKAKKERWVGIGLGVIASIVASTILAIIKFLYDRRKVAQSGSRGNLSPSPHTT